MRSLSLSAACASKGTASLRSRAALDRPGRPTPTAIGGMSGRGRLDRSIASARAIWPPRRRTNEDVEPDGSRAPSRAATGTHGTWYRRRRDRSSAAPRRSPIPSSASVVLSARAMPKRRARSRVARRTCIICKITHETHGTCSKHRLQNAAVASTQKPQAVPSRSRSLLRRPNCLRIRTTPVSAWRTPFGRARSGSACAATTR